MATCAICGQAVGTAVAIAHQNALMPREVYQQRIQELQQVLMEDDCWLPGLVWAIPALTKQADLSASCGDPEPLRNGVDRAVADAGNCWCGVPGAEVTYDFGAARRVRHVRLVFDSDLNRSRGCGKAGMNCRYSPAFPDNTLPATLVRAFRIEAQDEQGQWHSLYREQSNRRRLVTLNLDVNAQALRLIPESTWGDPVVRVFGFDVST